jgi:hypothetical protein
MKEKDESSALKKFFLTTAEYPILSGFSAGLCPIFFYYSNNYPLINSWKHLGFFIVLFLVSPVVVHSLGHRFSKLSILKPIGKYILTFLTIFSFLFFLHLCLYASVYLGITAGVIVIAVLGSYFLYLHLKKIIVFRLLLGVVGFFSLIPILVKQLNYSNEWQLQPDNIENVVFKKRPIVYFIKPDGYTNFSEFKKGYYKIDNSPFKEHLLQNNFKS